MLKLFVRDQNLSLKLSDFGCDLAITWARFDLIKFYEIFVALKEA